VGVKEMRQKLTPPAAVQKDLKKIRPSLKKFLTACMYAG
jgi:hypothetical protein